jgi:hypothetical protein
MADPFMQGEQQLLPSYRRGGPDAIVSRNATWRPILKEVAKAGKLRADASYWRTARN